MNIGTVKEIKTHEYRVGLTPACVRAYCSRGHNVFVEKGAGADTGFDGIVHYCVANMPGSVSLSSTLALTSTTLRYGLMLAEHGFEKACQNSRELALGVNLYMGRCVYENVAKSLAVEYSPLDELISRKHGWRAMHCAHRR